MIVAMPLDNGLSLLGFTMDGQPGDANGNPVTGADLATGISAGTLHVGETRTIELTVQVVGPPDNMTHFVFAPDWGHTFKMCSTDAPIVDSFAGPTDTVQYMADDPGPGYGGQGGSNVGAGGSAPELPAEPEEMGECGCRTVGHDLPAAGGPLALLALLAAAGLRRRRLDG
jgi:MYXO-CTERM domain-containing protein